MTSGGTGGAGRLRPTFRVPLDLPRDEAVAGLREALGRDVTMAGRWRGKGRWVELHVPTVERRFWSPYLSVRVDAEEGRSSLFARFAPYPGVWTFFMFVYFGVVFLGVFGAVLGYVQWVSGLGAWGFWVAAAGVPVLAGLHGAGALGKRLGHDQMRRLEADLERVAAGLPRPSGSAE